MSDIIPFPGVQSEAPTQKTLMSVSEVEKYGKLFIASKLFKDVGSVAAAVVKIQAGQELGFPPFASMKGFHIIHGQVSPSARMLASILKSSPGYDYEVEELSPKRAAIKLLQTGKAPVTVEFTWQEAVTAGLPSGVNGQTWKKYPERMLFARLMSKVFAVYTPHLTNGAPLYIPEELDERVDGDGVPMEDIPDGSDAEVSVKNLDDEKVSEIEDLIQKTGANKQALLDYYKVSGLHQMKDKDYKHAKTTLRLKLDAMDSTSTPELGDQQ